MEELIIISGKISNFSLDINSIFYSDSLLVNGSNSNKKWVNEKNEQFILLGDFFGERQKESIIKINDYKIFESHKNIKKVEGRFILIKIYPNNNLEIWTDYFGRYDIYYKKESDYIMISNQLSPFFKYGLCDGQLDPVGISHSLTVYGSRPAKKHTKYKNLNRLGVGEVLKISSNTIKVVPQKFIPINSNPNFAGNELEKYSDLFINSIKSRASNEGNIVFLSSGWDSTSILAVLVHLYGKNKVKCIIGRMKYSESSGVINQFEVDRAKAIAEYYGVKLFVIDLDHQNNGEELFSEVHKLFKYNQFSSMTGLSHWQLSKKAGQIADGDESVFVGEMSDGAHNLGFSQYVSIFHPSSIDFREYSDKMASYLYGPTFLSRLIDGSYNSDPIWKIYLEFNKPVEFEALKSGKNEIIKQFLSSFFLRGGRIPLYSMNNGNFLTDFGKEKYNLISQNTYFDNILENVTPENIYSNYMNLYNSFHWQGSTVATIEHTIKANGLTCALPFHDIGMIDFFSEMPEGWGRGLDFNRTKYPLKWMLENKIDYPMQLQKGPHAYTYDIDPNFSLIAEIVHRSSFTSLFKNALKNRKFIDKLDSKWFNNNYIDEIISKYLSNKDLTDKEMTDISILSLHSMTDIT